MPDLMIVHTCWCESNLRWTEEVTGSTGMKYTVRYNEGDWSCTCPAFVFHGHKKCKHIRQIENDRCRWGEEAVMGSFVDRPADGKCPKCGGPIVGLAVGV